MIILPKTKLADVMHQNYHLIPIITRFGIKFGFGDKNIEQVCTQYKINTCFFLEIINSFNDEDYSPTGKLRELPLEITVKYLLNSHNYFNNIKLPLIEKLIHKLNWEKPENQKNKAILNKFFNEYRDEVIEHTTHEENDVYPFILNIEKNFKLGFANEDFKTILKIKSVKDYADSHDELNSTLLDLKNIIIKYLPPAENSQIIEQILVEIFDLEKDMADHSLIENTVLIPAATKMESKLRKQLNLVK